MNAFQLEKEKTRIDSDRLGAGAPLPPHLAPPHPPCPPWAPPGPSRQPAPARPPPPSALAGTRVQVSRFSAVDPSRIRGPQPAHLRAPPGRRPPCRPWARPPPPAPRARPGPPVRAAPRRLPSHVRVTSGTAPRLRGNRQGTLCLRVSLQPGPTGPASESRDNSDKSRYDSDKPRSDSDNSDESAARSVRDS